SLRQVHNRSELSPRFQAETPLEDNRQPPSDSKSNATEIPQPQPPPSTPTRARNVASPSSTVVTPRAVRNGLAKSPDATTPRRQLAHETDGRASKTPSPDATEGGIAAKGRSPRSPRPPSSLRVKSATERSSPATPRASPNTPPKTSPGTPRKASARELRLPKLASSPAPPQEASPAPDSHSKITLPKLIEPSSQAARMAY
ncbi:proteoglycan 4, partial [Harpegnathos saltator]|uniref:proteoglycan 4 n=1 Tax=Harpegnathos saltator TaxID=610380 RepID=UPI000DBEE66F